MLKHYFFYSRNGTPKSLSRSFNGGGGGRQHGISEVALLQEKLEVTKEQLEAVSKKREEDLEMYLKMASDSKRYFSQQIKEAVKKYND